MAYYTSSFTGSGMQMVPYNSAPRSSASRRSGSSSPVESYYGDSPYSSTSSSSRSRASRQAQTEVSTTSVQTMGSPELEGYVSGQAPAAYFHNNAVRAEWDARERSKQQRMLPPPTRVEDLYQSPRSSAGKSWRDDENASIAPEDSISNVGSVRSGAGVSQRQYYTSASRASRKLERDRGYPPSASLRSGGSDARTEIANGRRVREMAPRRAVM